MSKYTFETSDLEEMRAVLAFVAEGVRASTPAADGARGENADLALWLESMPTESRRTIDALVLHGHDGTTITELAAELGVTPARLGGQDIEDALDPSGALGRGLGEDDLAS